VREDEAVSVGLCAGCRHARVIETARSRFWLCGRSATDSRFARYPRLPVLECPGYEPGAGEAPGGGLPRGNL
jgi:hypothetical protein